MNVDEVVNKLNEMNALDPSVIAKLIAFRVPCNQALADHPTVQVGNTGKGFEVGLLGVLNGLIGVGSDGWGFLAVELSDDGTQVIRFFHREVVELPA